MIILFLPGKLEQENANDMSCTPTQPDGLINIFTQTFKIFVKDSVN